MQYFPLYFDLNAKPVLVVGGGEVASRKVDMLIRAGAKVTIVSPEITSYLREEFENNKCHWLKQEYDESLLEGFIQVWATTDCSELNHQVHKHAKSRGVMVNVVDDKPYCDFITPSIVNRGRIQVAISSGGASPVLARNIRQQIEMTLNSNLSLLAEFAALKREDIQSKFDSVTERKLFWERFFNDSDVQLSDSMEKLEIIYQDLLSVEIKETLSRNWLEFGADVEWLSLKALKQMQKADRVFYPTGCPFDFIDLCRRDAERKVYSDLNELNEILKSTDEINSGLICIFIPKQEGGIRSKYEAQIGNDLLFRIIQ